MYLMILESKSKYNSWKKKSFHFIWIGLCKSIFGIDKDDVRPNQSIEQSLFESTLRQTIYYFYWVGFAFIKHVQDADSVNFTEKEN